MGTPFPLDLALPFLRNSQVFNETEEVMEPLSGVINGQARTLRVSNAPLIYDPLGAWGPAATITVYDANEDVVDPTLYVVTSTRQGAIQFVTAPTLGGDPLPPFYADYTWADLDLPTLYRAVVQGVSEMESRFYRGFLLAPITGSTTPIAGQLDACVTDATGQDPSGPGGTFFSTSIVQINFLLMCTYYRLARDYLWQAGKSAYAYREGHMGMEINPQSALKAQTDHMKALNTDLIAALDQARAEWDSSNEGLGAAIFSPSSAGYNSWFNWQDGCAGITGYGGYIGG